jgi:hypothetical protein
MQRNGPVARDRGDEDETTFGRVISSSLQRAWRKGNPVEAARLHLR